jgi:hypothetical protein
MCVADLPVAGVPLWHVAQFVVEVNVPWSGFCVDCQFDTEMWHASQLPVTPLCTAVLGFCVAPKAPALWQVAHWVLMDTDLWKLPGFHEV